MWLQLQSPILPQPRALVLMTSRTSLLPHPLMTRPGNSPTDLRSFQPLCQPPVTQSSPLPTLVPTQQHHRAGFASSQAIYLQRQFPLQIFMAKYRMSSRPGLLWRGLLPVHKYYTGKSSRGASRSPWIWHAAQTPTHSLKSSHLTQSSGGGPTMDCFLCYGSLVQRIQQLMKPENPTYGGWMEKPSSTVTWAPLSDL